MSSGRVSTATAASAEVTTRNRCHRGPTGRPVGVSCNTAAMTAKKRTKLIELAAIASVVIASELPRRMPTR